MPAPPHDVALRRVIGAGALIAGTVALAVGAIVLELRSSGVPLGGPAPLEAAARVEGPALESAPQPELQRYRAEKARELEALGWVDARAGIARIPIDSAMRLMAEDGLRAVPADPEDAP